MVRIAGVNLPNKRIEIALTYICGIGRSLSKSILLKLNISFDTKTDGLNEKELSLLREEISKLALEGDLKRKNQNDLKRLSEIGCYRGYRHRRGLPCRGQRTRTNCRTKKGKKVTIANKKK